ncbi:MAG: DUF58 domain-containing protein [Candidatus Poribacteria bacterium]|nr:DUF58 domain-containing protein [Candidatus Poribacteria bacterium]
MQRKFASLGKGMDEKEILKKIRRIDIFTNRLVNTVFAGEYKSIFKGQGITFDEVREYQEGDEIRTIDWNVTARMGHAYVKKYVEERELVMMLLVDMSASTAFGSIPETKAEIAAEIAALLAFSAIKNNDKVGLICFTDTVEHFVAPRKGKRHVLRVVRDILRFQPNHSGTAIAEALIFADQVLKPHSVVFLISDFKDTDYQKQLRITGKRHSLIAITLQDRREIEMPNVGLIEFEDAETGERVVVDTRSEQARQLYAELTQKTDAERLQVFRGSQTDFINIQTDKSYVAPLMRFFRQRAARS